MVSQTAAFSIPRLILGTWALGGGNDWGPTSEQDALDTLAAALDAGVQMLDTSPVYGAGEAERLIGTALQGRRSRVLLASKCGISLAGGRPDHDLRPQSIMAECEASLQRMQTDYIDLYQIHWPDPKVNLQDSLGALLRLKEQGKIREIGVCNFAPQQVIEALKTAPLASVQNPFSLLNRGQEELRALCMQHKLPFLAYGVLGGGILSGKYKQAPNFRRCDARRYFYPYYFGDGFAAAVAVAARVKKLAAQKGVCPSALAISWALYQPGISGVLFGARTPAQVKENIQASAICLNQEEINFLAHD